jgi:hypothetical protein
LGCCECRNRGEDEHRRGEERADVHGNLRISRLAAVETVPFMNLNGAPESLPAGMRRARGE